MLKQGHIVVCSFCLIHMTFTSIHPFHITLNQQNRWDGQMQKNTTFIFKNLEWIQEFLTVLSTIKVYIRSNFSLVWVKHDKRNPSRSEFERKIITCKRSLLQNKKLSYKNDINNNNHAKRVKNLWYVFFVIDQLKKIINSNFHVLWRSNIIKIYSLIQCSPYQSSNRKKKKKYSQMYFAII